MHSSGTNCISRRDGEQAQIAPMRIAKPLLLVSTPLGMITGLIEAYRLVGGLAILMFAMMAMLGVAAAGVVYTIRKEKKEWTASKSSS